MSYPELVGNVNPFEHWVRHGKAEGRIGYFPEEFKPFDRDYYLLANPELIANVNPFEHWIRHGKAEGDQARLQ